MSSARTYRAGESLQNFCRACEADRLHTVVVVDADGRPIRVACGFCHSEHNYRGGATVEPRVGKGAAEAATTGPARRTASPDRPPFPIVSERERTATPMTVSDTDDLELLLRERVLRIAH